MRTVKFLFVVLLLYALLCSCAIEESGFDFIISSSDKTVFDLVTKSYTDTQLFELAMFMGSIEEFNDQYPIECLRKTGDDYRAAFLGKDSIAVAYFDNIGNKSWGWVYDISLLRSDFLDLSLGQSLNDVMTLDPDGSYIFAYAGSDEFPRESVHFTNDGYMFIIEYDDSNIIININEELT